MVSKALITHPLFLLSVSSFLLVMPVESKKLRGTSSYSIASEAHDVYRIVYDHYSDILELYYTLDKAPATERPYYASKLVHTVVAHVQQDKLPLYGNFLNRLWKNMSQYSAANTPLIKFERVLAEDALGHLNKYYNKIVEADIDSQKLSDLIESLKRIRSVVQASVEYAREELRIKVVELEAEIQHLKTELTQEKEKRKQVEQLIAHSNVRR
jgi:hypothetical protein